MAVADNNKPVTILNRNKPVFYCVSADIYDHLLDMTGDIHVAEIMEQRKHETPIRVSLDDLNF